MGTSKERTDQETNAGLPTRSLEMIVVGAFGGTLPCQVVDLSQSAYI